MYRSRVGYAPGVSFNDDPPAATSFPAHMHGLHRGVDKRYLKAAPVKATSIMCSYWHSRTGVRSSTAERCARHMSA